jgi:hypothetical protein
VSASSTASVLEAGNNDGRISIASASGTHLLLINVKSHPRDGLLEIESSTELQLIDDDPRSTRMLRRSLKQILRDQQVEQLVLCKGPERGPYSNTPARTKIEFMVLYNGQVPVTALPSPATRKWAKGRELVSSGVMRRVKPQLHQLYTQAFETAAYAFFKQAGSR